MSITYVILGPPHHGVTRHGQALAGQPQVHLKHVSAGETTLAEILERPEGPVHLHLTDHLLGDNHDEICRHIALIEGSQRPVHVTLHDIPQPEEGADRYARRRDLYRRLALAAASVQVCSDIERAHLSEISGRADIHVVRLPIDRQPDDVLQTRRDAAQHGSGRDPGKSRRAERAGEQRPRIGVLGFIHPGKNAELAIEMAAQHGCDVLLMGEVGPGHADYADDLVNRAQRLDVRCEITGFLSEERMNEVIAEVDVPLAPYRHISASGSIGRWIASGRRPIAFATGWVKELAALAPWAVCAVDVHDQTECSAAIQKALTDDGFTWNIGETSGVISTAEAARRQRELLEVAMMADSERPTSIDVVVTHYRDEQRLAWVLEALRRQTYPQRAIRITVADDGSPTLPSVPHGIQVVTQADDGFRAAAARNLGAKAGSGDLILFLDGDTIPEPTYCEAMAQAFSELGYESAVDPARDEVDSAAKRTEKNGSTTGRTAGSLLVGKRFHADFTGLSSEEIVYWMQSRVNPSASEVITSAASDRGVNSIESTMQRRENDVNRDQAQPVLLDDPQWLRDGYARTNNLREAGSGDWRLVISAVMGMSRAAFEALDGFDETLVGYGGEDWDLAYRAWNNGVELRHVPAAIAWHDGPDAGARPGLAKIKEQEQLTLAARIPQPSVRGRAGVWPRPRVAIRWECEELSASIEYAVLESWLALGDVSVWATSAWRSPLAGDPRVRGENLPHDVEMRAEYLATLTEPVALREPRRLLSLLDDGPLAGQGVFATRTRDRARGVLPRNLNADGDRRAAYRSENSRSNGVWEPIGADQNNSADLLEPLDLEAYGRRWWA